MKKDEPIIRSLLDTDFYKFSMGQYIWKYHLDVPVTFRLANRTSSVRLAEYVDMGRLKEELDHVRSLKFGNSDLHYLRGTNEYGDRMFQEDYLEFLKGLRLPDFNYWYNTPRNQINLEFTGPWSSVTYWEIPALAIVTELYGESLMQDLTRHEREVMYAQGLLRLHEKIKRLRTRPHVKFSEFGTRRRFSRQWHERVVDMLVAEIPDQILGTSNVKLASDHNVLPMGTCPHEPGMVLAALSDGSPEGIRRSQHQLMDGWWRLYGWGLSIALPDTFGSDFFLKNVFNQERARVWKGVRQDSGSAAEFGEKLIAHYQSQGIDAKEKLFIPSDGLDLDMIFSLDDQFRGRIRMSPGWGTNLTNDLGFKTLSLVVKPIRANGQGLVKLSDNLAKAIGDPKDVERYKGIFGYASDFLEECRY